MNNIDQFNEYRKQTAPQGSSLYYSLLLTAEEKRIAIIALHAFNNELTKIAEQNAEKTVLQAKLVWWQQEWQRMLVGEAQHPITKILYSQQLDFWPGKSERIERMYTQYLTEEALTSNNAKNSSAKSISSESSLLPALVQEWVDGALIKLDCDHLCTEQDLAFFCYREMGICAILSAYVLGFKQQSSLKGVQDLAESMASVNIITNLAKHLRRGWCFIPLDWLAQHQVSEEHLQTESMSPELKAVLQQLSNHAQTKFLSGMEKIAKEDKPTLLPIIIQATIANKLRQEIVKADFPLFNQRISLTPLRKLFIALQTYWQM